MAFENESLRKGRRVGEKPAEEPPLKSSARDPHARAGDKPDLPHSPHAEAEIDIFLRVDLWIKPSGRSIGIASDGEIGSGEPVVTGDRAVDAHTDRLESIEQPIGKRRTVVDMTRARDGNASGALECPHHDIDPIRRHPRIGI